MIKYSFIIPVKEINDYIRESVPIILEIKRDDLEILVYPDNVSTDSWKFTKQIGTGPVGPAEKRSLAMRDATGEILIFIDDDAYPEKNFLDILDLDFKDSNIVAVGGPAITPKEDTFWQKVSGAVFLSPLSGGFPERYAPVGKKKFVSDWPSVNLSVRKNAFKDVGGFDSDYWPGEDTKLCLDLVAASNGKILYDPKLIAYHHRREGLLKHLNQVGGYGLHRGFFAKKFPETSFKLKYFIPSIFSSFILFGPLLSFYSSSIRSIFFMGLLVYFLALLKALSDILKFEKSIIVALFSLYYIFLTHIVYGFRFIQGFVFTTNLKSKLR